MLGFDDFDPDKLTIHRAALYAFLYFCVAGPIRWLVAFLPVIDGNPAGAVLLIGSLFWGPAAVLGGVAGTLVTDIVIDATSTGTLCRALAAGLTSATAYTLWGVLHRERPGDGPSVRQTARRFGAYAIVAVVSLTLFAATYAWSLELLSLASFSVVAPTKLFDWLPFAVIAFPIWHVLERRVGVGRTLTERVQQFPVREWGRYRKALFLATPVTWFVVGTVVSYVFRATDLVPAERIGRRLVPLATTVLDLAGPRGARVQMLGGAIALVLICWLLRDASRRGTY